MRIVIVEDEVAIREGMGKMIESQTRHQIVGEAVDGEEGLQMVLRLRPDLVITDVRMPRMTGLQMLEELSRRKVDVHCIILSGYSEFEYVQKAIRYGADDYLLKPLAAEDVTEMLETVEEKIQRQRISAYGQPENRIRDILLGNIEETDESIQEMCKACGFETDMKYELMGGYIADVPLSYKEFVEHQIVELKKMYEGFRIYLLYQENQQMFFCLTAGRNLTEAGKRGYENTFYNQMIEKERKREELPVWAKVDCTERNLQQARRNLESNLEYALVLDREGWITDERVQNYHAETYEYPLEIGNRLKNALCQGDNEEIIKAGNAFTAYMESHYYRPSDVRHGFVKSYHLVSDTLRDIDKVLHEQLQNSGIVQRLENVLTFKELKDIWEDIIRIILRNREEREDISNYIIKKAINYIREHYQQEITQEEMSRKLEITPEYLSALFKREVGIGFSLFLKRFRISHAKRLLKGTDMKVYEIAEKVGYSDAKYFARVFKEEMGVTPGEYRQMN